MAQHAFKGRGELTLGGSTIEVATEIELRQDMQTAPIAHWPNLATGDDPGGIAKVAQRLRGLYLDMVLHDYAPAMLGTLLGAATVTGTATGTKEINLLASVPDTAVALSFNGQNKLDGKDWDMSIPKFLPEVIPVLAVVGARIAGYRITGHALRDTSATGREYGYLTVTTG